MTPERFKKIANDPDEPLSSGERIWIGAMSIGLSLLLMSPLIGWALRDHRVEEDKSTPSQQIEENVDK